MSLLNDFAHVSKALPCPVCAKPDWCLVDRLNPNDPPRAICARIESSTRWGDAGWYHQFRQEAHRPHTYQSQTKSIRLADDRNRKLSRLVKQSLARVTNLTRDSLAKELRVTAASLEALVVGRLHNAWSFPMSNATGEVIGIRLRYPEGRKLCVRGSSQGLFLPAQIAEESVLWICEGPTDTAALLSLELPAVGRPNCQGGTRLLVELTRRRRPRKIVLVADRDKPGMEGANRLASTLVAVCPDVRIIIPPIGVKDAREWVASGAKRGTLIAAANDAIPHKATLSRPNLGGPR